MRSRLVGVTVQPGWLQPLLAELVVSGGAGTAHTENQHIGIPQAGGLFIGVHGDAFKTLQAWLQAGIQAVRHAVQRRGNHEGHRHGNGQRHDPFRQQYAGDNQAKFTVGGEADCSEERGARTQAERGEQQKEQKPLERQQYANPQCKQQCVEVGQAGHADLQEETHQKHFPQAPE